MDQVSIKYTNIFLCKTLQNLPKFGFLVRKQTIWHPWSQSKKFDQHKMLTIHSRGRSEESFVARFIAS
jgi:hypothetical protein